MPPNDFAITCAALGRGVVIMFAVPVLLLACAACGVIGLAVLYLR